MKKLGLFFYFSLLLLFASGKIYSAKYVFFTNLDEYAVNAYWNFFASSSYGSEFIGLPFTDATFQSNKITDFDVAVFAMGNYPLSARTESGQNIVINKIKDMIAAGKKVLIMSKVGLIAEYDPKSQVKSPDVDNFFVNTMGINYLGRLPMNYVSGTTTNYMGFVARGGPTDVVGRATVKWCNGGITLAGITHWPLGYVLELDVFKSKDATKYPVVDYFLREQGSPMSDTAIAIRATSGNAKIVYFSYGFENIADSNHRKAIMKYAMDWLTEGAPQPGPQIEAIADPVEFGQVNVGDSLDLTVSYRNIGKEQLKVTATSIDGLAGDDIFKIVSGAKTVTLKTGDIHSLTVRFKPKEKKKYTDFLAVSSNSTTESEKAIEINGYGYIEEGAKITTDLEGNKLDFGKIKPGANLIKTITVTNPGNLDLHISKVEFVSNDDDAFTLIEGGQPATVKPNGSTEIKIKFAPKEEKKIYSAKLKIESDAVNNIALELDFTGEGDVTGSAENSSVINSKFSLSVSPNPAKENINICYELLKEASENIKLYITGLDGKLLQYIYSGAIEAGKYNKELSAFNFNSGIIFINLENEDGIITIPVIINR